MDFLMTERRKRKEGTQNTEKDQFQDKKSAKVMGIKGK